MRSKNGAQSIGKSRGGWTTKIHMIAANERTAVSFRLSPGQAGDAPEGRKLLSETPLTAEAVAMDRACEGDETRELVAKLGSSPEVPPKSNRKEPWQYDKEIHRLRNEVERLFGLLKRFRRIFTRYDKLDVVFVSFIYLALVVVALR